MPFSPESIAAVRSSVDLVQLISENLPLTRKGRDYFGVCPFHPDKNPSFSVSPEKQLYYCFGCGASGDAVDWMMKIRSLSFADAVRELAAYGLVMLVEDSDRQGPGNYTLPKGKKPGPKTHTRDEDADDPLPSEMWQEKATAFVAACRLALMENKKALKRLAKSRGIKPETAERFRLGMHTDPNWWRPRKSWGLPDVQGKDGAIYRNFKIDSGLVIPLMHTDVALRIRIRRPEGDPKYKIVPGSFMAPLIIDAGPNKPGVVIVESELCAMLLSQETGSIAPIIAMGSAQARPKPGLAEDLHRFGFILNALDFDGAGAAASRKYWNKTFPRNIRWPVTTGKDPTDAFLVGLDLKAWVQAGFPGPSGSGASLLNRKNGGCGEMVSDKLEAAADAVGVPAGVKRLTELLTGVPVVIVNSESRITIKEDRGWAAKNWDRARAIADLVYLDPEVFDWISRHKDREITKGNLTSCHK